MSIGSRVGIGVGVLFINSDHDTRDPRARAGAGRSARIVVHDGVFVGSGATILSGVELAQGCVIAAGAVVKESTLPHGLYVGVPARRIKDLPVVFD
ncbi:acyltransferase [Rathayibacter agropyri]|nr:acyltransferase [Rathayibacter agropyri]